MATFYLKNRLKFLLYPNITRSIFMFSHHISIVLFLFVVTVLPKSTECFYIDKPSCSYQVPELDEVVLQVHQSPLQPENDGDVSDVRRQRSVTTESSFRNLRIKIYYDNSSIEELPTIEHRNYVRQLLVPEAVSFWESTLSVRFLQDVTIRLNRKCETSQYYVNFKRQACQKNCREFTKCGEVVVPEDHLNQCYACTSDNPASCSYSGPEGTGVSDADFILYVSAVQTERCAGKETVAYAAHCQQEDTLDRPIAGHVNLCPRSISISRKDQEVLVSTVKHEILHALGFSAGLYAFYRDDNGAALTPRNGHGRPLSMNRARGVYEWSENVVKTINRTDWWTKNGRMNHTVYMMVTPRVLKEAREYFDCVTLEGAELENQGMDGTIFSHWEKRVFENEAMTGTHTQNPIYSRLTLALMEDTGWYKANYDVAEQMSWGAGGDGCEFATKSCGEWIETREKTNRPPSPFCKDVKFNSKVSDIMTTCTLTRRAVGLCNMRDHGIDLPREYQYFGSRGDSRSNSYGGSVELADYCPYVQEFEWNNTVSLKERDSRCMLLENTPEASNNAALENYGPDSRCFDHGGTWTQRRCRWKRSYERLGSGCYTFDCADGRLWLRVGNNSYPCYENGQSIQIKRVIDGWLHEGSIVCPRCVDLCTNDTFKCLRDEKPSNYVGDAPIAVPCAASHFAAISQKLSIVSLIIVVCFSDEISSVIRSLVLRNL